MLVHFLLLLVSEVRNAGDSNKCTGFIILGSGSLLIQISFFSRVLIDLEGRYLNDSLLPHQLLMMIGMSLDSAEAICFNIVTLKNISWKII